MRSTATEVKSMAPAGDGAGAGAGAGGGMLITGGGILPSNTDCAGAGMGAGAGAGAGAGLAQAIDTSKTMTSISPTIILFTIAPFHTNIYFTIL